MARRYWSWPTPRASTALWSLLALPALCALLITTAAAPPGGEAVEPVVASAEEGAAAATPASGEALEPADLHAEERAADAPAVLLAAGDIARCGQPGSEATAALLDRLIGTIVTLGDNAYESGTTAEFQRCYEPTWGRHKARTRPAPGNHDYGTRGGAGYYAYFGAAAGEPGKGYYSYDLGTWHIVALNSNCAPVGGCQAGSAQERWLRADLAAHPARCTLAYWHHPRFNSGRHGSTIEMQPIWQALYDAGADVVLAGHEHVYERFAPQDAEGVADPARGLRQFTVGTGGASLYHLPGGIANSEVRSDSTYGVLQLTLLPAGYDWQFIPVAGGTFTDAGSGACH